MKRNRRDAETDVLDPRQNVKHALESMQFTGQGVRSQVLEIELEGATRRS